MVLTSTARTCQPDPGDTGTPSPRPSKVTAMLVSLTQVAVRSTHDREDEGLGAACVYVQVVTGTHRSKGTERSSVLTEIRAGRRKGQGPPWRLEQGYILYFTPADSKQLFSKRQRLGVCAAQVLRCHQQLFWSKGLG